MLPTLIRLCIVNVYFASKNITYFTVLKSKLLLSCFRCIYQLIKGAKEVLLNLVVKSNKVVFVSFWYMTFGIMSIRLGELFQIPWTDKVALLRVNRRLSICGYGSS